MNKYEITTITKEDSANLAKKEIESSGGKVLDSKSWGQKNLTFPIKKETAGYFSSIIFEIDPAKISELNKKLNLNSDLLRHLILATTSEKFAIPPKAMAKKPEAIKKEEPTEVIEKIEEKVEKPKPAKEEKVEKKIAKTKKETKPKIKKEAPQPKVSKAAQEIEAEAVSTEERLKALDQKLDELLKE
jgi:ribosomal protein S6